MLIPCWDAGSATRNREPILAALGPWIASADHPSILEIASGTGEHAVGYAKAFPDASFLVTERDEAGLRWVECTMTRSSMLI